MRSRVPDNAVPPGGEACRASAPGKIIIFGEHAVVFGRPAIAVPVTQVSAIVTVEPATDRRGLTIVAIDVDRTIRLSEAPHNDPLAAVARLTLERLRRDEPDAILSIQSTVPIASGMGSGAAVSTAISRGLAQFLGISLSPELVSNIVFEIERIHHGTPSGIDNTVIAFEKPIFFIPGQPIEVIAPARPFTLLIADSGVRSSTRTVVEQVRAVWRIDTSRYESLFDRIGTIAKEARSGIETGDVQRLGPLMNENHRLLQDLQVSSTDLDRLVNSARRAGAAGAKMSGAGRGGNMIALVSPPDIQRVTQALGDAGATRVLTTRVGARQE